MDQNRFFEVVETYQQWVRRAVALFNEHRGLRDPTEWRSAGLPRTGFIDAAQTIRYSFHGIGCLVEMPEGVIDWDFGQNGRIDGFDLWRLKTFVEENRLLFPESVNAGALRSAFDLAVERGAIKKDGNDKYGNLFYRVA